MGRTRSLAQAAMLPDPEERWDEGDDEGGLLPRKTAAAQAPGTRDVSTTGAGVLASATRLAQRNLNLTFSVSQTPSSYLSYATLLASLHPARVFSLPPSSTPE